jgi:hypothetical protein
MKWFRLPSPAMVVALGALVMGAEGGVTAAALITSATIKDNTIRSVDIRDGALKSIDVANGTLTGADVANNSLTGADVKESSLGKVPSTANATNAGKVDGLDANSLTRVARMRTDQTLELTAAWQTFGDTLSITAPRAGFVMIHGGTTFINDSCTTNCAVAGQIRHVQSGTTSTAASQYFSTGMLGANVSYAWVFPVKAGVNTFEIRVTHGFVGNGELSAISGELAAIYSPFGPTGTATLATG